MKKQIIALALSLITTAAMAGNEGPQAAPKLPSPVIAQKTVGSGFVPPDYPVGETTNIHADGTVDMVRYYRGDRTEVIELATLSKAALAKVKANVEATKAGELVAENPDAPECMDAPSYTYKAIHASGEEVEVGARYGCKDYRKKNETRADQKVIQILDALSQLGEKY